MVRHTLACRLESAKEQGEDITCDVLGLPTVKQTGSRRLHFDIEQACSSQLGSKSDIDC